MLFNKSEVKFVLGIVGIVIGWLGLFPSKNSLIIKYMASNITPNSLWYNESIILMKFFYILVPLASLFTLYKLLNYGIKYNVFCLRDLVRKLDDLFS